MPKLHPRPWHRGSTFGDGPRRPLDREQRARFRFLLNAHRRARRLTPCSELIGNALIRHLGVAGQCDPSHQTLADDVGITARTVRRALVAMRNLGLLLWQNRLIRIGPRVTQTSNAYLLVPSDQNPPANPGGHSDRQILKQAFSLLSAPVPEVSEREARAARAGLAAVAARRSGLIVSKLLMKGS